jgi:methylase of polypeptide subunit release factors
VCRGVYEPAEDTELLLEAMDTAGLCSPLIDVGPGTGIEALYAARQGFEVIAIDVSWTAALNTMINSSRNTSIHVVQGSTLQSIRRGACCSAVFNTPYLPVSDSIPGGEAWSGGDRGVKQAVEFLREAGRAGCRRLVIVTSSTADVESLLEEAARHGYKTRTASSRHMFFETMIALILEKEGRP